MLRECQHQMGTVGFVKKLAFLICNFSAIFYGSKEYLKKVSILLEQNPEDKEPLSPPCSEPPFNEQGRWASFLQDTFKSLELILSCTPLSSGRRLAPLSSFLSEGFPAPEECTKLILNNCATTPEFAIFIRLSLLNLTFSQPMLRPHIISFGSLNIKKGCPHGGGRTGPGSQDHPTVPPGSRAAAGLLQPWVVGTSLWLGTGCPQHQSPNPANR